MLIRNWILEEVSGKYVNFEALCRELVSKARKHKYTTSEMEIRILLERLIKDRMVDTCQFLAEERTYSPTIYDERNIYWYWFKSSSSQQGHNSNLVE